MADERQPGEEVPASGIRKWLETHWLPVITGIVIATAGTTYVVVDKLLIQPKDTEIKVKEDLLSYFRTRLEHFTDEMMKTSGQFEQLKLRNSLAGDEINSLDTKIKNLNSTTSTLENKINEVKEALKKVESTQIVQKGQEISTLLQQLEGLDKDKLAQRLSAIETAVNAPFLGAMITTDLGPHGPTTTDGVVIASIVGAKIQIQGIKPNWGSIQGIIDREVVAYASMDYDRSGAESGSLTMLIPKGKTWEIRVPQSRELLKSGVTVYWIPIGVKKAEEKSAS